jgi:Outer membrane protein Omp28
MKKNILYILLFSLSFFACKEEPIIIPPLGGNSEPTNSVVRKVFIEEYTGAGCVNCPDGAAILNDLQKNTYKDKVILVAIHAGFFTKKSQVPKEAVYDLSSPKGNELQLFLGEPTGYPAAIMNRKTRDANGSLVADSKDQWASIIQTEAKEKGAAKIVFKNGYDDTNRNLQLNFTIEALENLTGDYAYTIMVTEDNIVDAQKTPNGVKTDYTHRHVLRDILTPAQGTAITEKLTKGAVVSRSMNFKLPTNWKSTNCEVIVLLHKVGTSKEVIQAEEIKIN